jgi:hypothetical protein
MPSTVQPTIVTAQTERVPPEGPVFYVGLRIGDSDLGLPFSDSWPPPAARGR